MEIWTRLAQFAELETPRLYLRPIRYSDGQAFHQIASNPENLCFIFPQTLSQEESQILLVTAFMKQPLGIWGIFHKNHPQELIGVIRLENIHAQARQAEVGYFLHQDFWNQGLMTEALRTIVYLCFYEFGLREILVKTHLENRASQRVAEKIGFRASRQYRGSDRYTHKMREYKDFIMKSTDFRLEEEIIE